MRIVFDNSPFLQSSRRGQGPSGVAKWSFGALSGLSKILPDSELLGISPGFRSRIVNAADLGPNVKFKRVPLPSRIHHLAELVGLEPRIETWTGNVDVVLGNCYIPAKSKKAASVPVIYDLSIITHPEMHPKDRVLYLSGQLKRVVARADLVITISECIRQEIAEHFELPFERIAVAPPSWEVLPFPSIQPSYENAGAIDPLPSDYLLFVGTLEPRKNIQGLLSAYNSLVRRKPETPPLLIVGGTGWGSEAFAQPLEEAVASGKVRQLGYVSDEQLANLYRGALGFVYPSLYEGFGMPIIEAMAAGCPVITSNISGTAEAAGDAALLICPTDLEEIEDSLERLIDDEGLREDLRKRGLARSAEFSWESTAASLREALERAVALG